MRRRRAMGVSLDCQRNGKPVARRGRKATGPSRSAGSPNVRDVTMVSTWCLELRSTSVGSRPSSGELGTPSRHDGLRVSSTHSGSLLQAGEDVNDRIEAIALGSQDEWK